MSQNAEVAIFEAAARGELPLPGASDFQAKLTTVSNKPEAIDSDPPRRELGDGVKRLQAFLHQESKAVRTLSPRQRKLLTAVCVIGLVTVVAVLGGVPQNWRPARERPASPAPTRTVTTTATTTARPTNRPTDTATATATATATPHYVNIAGQPEKSYEIRTDAKSNPIIFKIGASEPVPAKTVNGKLYVLINGVYYGVTP